MRFSCGFPINSFEIYERQLLMALLRSINVPNYVGINNAIFMKQDFF